MCLWLHSCYPSVSTCVFPNMEIKERKDGKRVWPAICCLSWELLSYFSAGRRKSDLDAGRVPSFLHPGLPVLIPVFLLSLSSSVPQ